MLEDEPVARPVHPPLKVPQTKRGGEKLSAGLVVPVQFPQEGLVVGEYASGLHLSAQIFFEPEARAEAGADKVPHFGAAVSENAGREDAEAVGKGRLLG